MYEVIVGNIGHVYHGPNKELAIDFYDTYAEKSCFGLGRAAYETVTLMKDNEILLEFTGEKDKRNRIMDIFKHRIKKVYRDIPIYLNFTNTHQIILGVRESRVRKNAFIFS